MTLSLLFALAAGATPLDPAPLQSSLARTVAPITTMAACADRSPRYESRYQEAFAAYVDLVDAAEALFGKSPVSRDDPPASGCGERAFAAYQAAAAASLGEARRALASLAERMPGLWVGSLPVCRDDVVESAIEPHFEDDSISVLTLTLVPAHKARLRMATERRVGLKLSVRIDGESVMAPHLQEPLTAGALSFSTPERNGLERVRTAALRPCTAGAD